MYNIDLNLKQCFSLLKNSIDFTQPNKPHLIKC